MHRNPRTVIASLGAAAVLSAAAAPAAMAADTSAQTTAAMRTAQERGLLDGLLGGLVGGTTGTTTSTTTSPDVITNLVNTVLTLPGADTAGVSTVTNLVTELLDAGLPADANVVTGLLDSVLGVVGTNAAPTDVITDLVGGLLSQGVGLVDLTSVVNGVLGDAGSGVVGLDTVTDIVNGLLAGGLPTDAAGLAGVLELLDLGALPTASLLTPVTDILDQLAANTALPAELRAAVQSLSDTVKGSGDATLTDSVMRTVGSVLGILGGNTALTKPVQDILGALSGLLTGSSTSSKNPTGTTSGGTKYIYATTPGKSTATTKALGDMRARVSRVVINKARTKATATISCPIVAVLGCSVKIKPTLSGKVSGATKSVLLVPGTQRKVALKLTNSSVKRLRARGGRLAVRATTTISSKSYNASRMLQVAKRR